MDAITGKSTSPVMWLGRGLLAAACLTALTGCGLEGPADTDAGTDTSTATQDVASGDGPAASPEHPAVPRAEITACGSTPTGLGTATVRVRNNAAGDYSSSVATVEFTSSDRKTQYAVAHVVLDGLGDSQTAVRRVVTVDQLPKPFHCHIEDLWATGRWKDDPEIAVWQKMEADALIASRGK